MLATTLHNLREFEQSISQQADDFLITGDAHKPEKKTFTFIGPLDGNPIIWNCQLQTLQSLAQSRQLKQMQQFIHIYNNQEIYHLEIGLYLKQIDLATIKRTIIMIRQYKNLRSGQHNYGPFYDFII